MRPYYTDPDVTLYHGHDLDVLPALEDGSVDCVVTSPPYFGLRDYGFDGQRGMESTPVEYVEGLVKVFSEIRRVLADDGTVWLNLGDAYYSGKGSPTQPDRKNEARRPPARILDRPGAAWARPKNLLGIPWRVALALQDDGWTLRQDNIWVKNNPMPEAVKDRTTRSHEYVFHLTKGRRYWYDADAIREQSDPKQTAHNERYAKEYAKHSERAATTGQPGNVNNVGIHSRPGKPGRNARSVWPMNAQPFPAAHFAVMPVKVAERCVLAGCKPGGTVLDPWSGSGTTGLAALTHGRKFVGIELSREYLDLSLATRFEGRAE